MLKVDFNNMTSQILGQQHGINIEDNVKLDKVWLQSCYDSVKAERGLGWQEWMLLPQASEQFLDEILDYAKRIKDSASDLVVFGIGGSALGVQSVASALTHLRFNSLSRGVRKAPRLHIEDNIDPLRFGSLLDVIDLENTHFLIATKSGNTSETLSQFLCIYDLLIKNVGKQKAVEAITIITGFGKGDLYDVAKVEGFKMYEVPKGAGGRFSVLSSVGLVAFAMIGLDIKQLLRGARSMIDKSFEPDIFANPALMTAYLQVKSIKSGKNIGVIMPYSDNLKYIADFYAQLWAESLGKEKDKDGNTINTGQTPVKSLGVTDQHSLVQLFNEGPFDKVVTFVSVMDFGKVVPIPKVEGVNIGEFLSGHTLNELLQAERIATEFALTNSKRPNFNIVLDKLDEFAIGELLSYFMMQTAFAGALLNIETYLQPGVEAGKVATFAMLNRKGYEDIKKAILTTPKNDKYIVG